MRKSLRNWRKRYTHRFLGTLALLLIGSWGGYHAVSTYCKPRPTAMLAANQQDVVARINPKNEALVLMAEREEVPENQEFMLLAGVKRSPSTQPKKTAPMIKPVTLIKEQPKTDDNSEEVLKEATQLIHQGKMVEARKCLNDYINENLKNEVSEAVISKALELGKETILGRKVFPDDPLCESHKVDVGDTFVRFAKRGKVPYQFLCKINQIDDPRRLIEGQRIKLVKGPIVLKVRMHELTMYVFLQDTLIARYDVGLGKNGKTPMGKWIVNDRIRKPVYTDPDTGKTYGPNDPDNPTGGFWVRLEGVEGDTVGKTGFGIHGTDEPDSIKKFMSKGCVRMRNHEMAQVFDLITPGATEVYTLP